MRILEELRFAEFENLSRKGDLVTVFRDLRGDTETPVSAFRKLPNPSHAFLLESVEGGERWGRYSFLGDEPRAMVRVFGKTVVLEQAGKRSFVEEENPLDAVRELLGRGVLARDPRLPPFVGGLVGYTGWGAVRWFEPKVPLRLGADPDFPDAEWMLADRLVIFDDLKQRVQLVSTVFLEEHRTAKAAYRHAIARLDTLQDALEKPAPPEPPLAKPTKLVQSWDRPGFEAAVARAQEYIRAGDCMQVVLSRRITGRYDGDPFELYRALRGVTPTPYLFYLHFGDRALAGASPELLVRAADGKVAVRPIAGTRRRGATPEEDRALEEELRADPKERAEHVMLVDLGRNDVGRVAAPGTVKVVEREVVERYSHVMHLVSHVTGELSDDADSLDAVAAAFPAGTVSGAPKVRAMEIVDELEPVPRGPYAGAAGMIGWDGRVDLAISIRTLALTGRELRVQAGAGIVHDSVPAKEWEETSHKMRAALAALGADEPKGGKAK